MRLNVSSTLLLAGASNEPAGTHTSRTMMLDELQALVAGCPADASYADYRFAVVQNNLLRKATRSTRLKSLRHLRELYALRPSIPLFAALRALWSDDADAQPVLALICAAARDPLVRCTIDSIATAPLGTPLGAHEFAAAVQDSFPDRFSAGVRARIGRNLASTWTQSGHLHAISRTAPKLRQRVHAHPAAALYALYLGHLGGLSGPALLSTPWTQVLDADPSTMRNLAEASARRGWLELAASGGMLEIGFSHLDGLVEAAA